MTVLLRQLHLVASQTRSPSGQLWNVRWLRYIALILVKHRTPHMIVKRVEIRRIRWSLFLPDKLWAILAKPVLRQWCCVSRPVAKLSFFSSDSCNFCFMWMIWKKFSENTVVFLSIMWCKFQEFKLHGFREIEFFLGGCFLCRTLYSLVFYCWWPVYKLTVYNDVLAHCLLKCGCEGNRCSSD